MVNRVSVYNKLLCASMGMAEKKRNLHVQPEREQPSFTDTLQTTTEIIFKFV